MVSSGEARTMTSRVPLTESLGTLEALHRRQRTVPGDRPSTLPRGPLSTGGYRAHNVFHGRDVRPSCSASIGLGHVDLARIRSVRRTAPKLGASLAPSPSLILKSVRLFRLFLLPPPSICSFLLLHFPPSILPLHSIPSSHPSFPSSIFSTHLLRCSWRLARCMSSS